jgi:hypothetical protein
MKRITAFVGVLTFLTFGLSEIPARATTTSYSESFTYAATPSSTLSSNWRTFLTSLTGSYTTITISSSLGGSISITDATFVPQVATKLNSSPPTGGTTQTWTVGSNKIVVGNCGGDLEISIGPNASICSCNLVGVYTVRPGIGNYNWGGQASTTCQAASQTLTVVFSIGGADTTPPTFPSPETFSVPENTTYVGAITTSESATITIFGGEDSSKFGITRTGDSSTSLSFLSAPNFEAPTDVGANNTYIVVFRALDGASNAGYETVTVTVTDVVETSTFNSLRLAGNVLTASYRTTIVITADVSVAAKVSFTANGERIPGCLGRLASGSASSFLATCSWRPSKRGGQLVGASSTPTSVGITGSSASINVNVAPRTTPR